MMPCLAVSWVLPHSCTVPVMYLSVCVMKGCNDAK